MLDQVGSLLPAAAGIALSPFPLVAVTLVVGGPRGRAPGLAFALGWVVGLSMLTAVAVGVGELVGSEDGEAGLRASWARVALGTALLALGVRKLARLPGGPSAAPGWAAGLTGAPPSRALATALALAALNPKNVAFALASVSTVGQAALTGGGVLVPAALFVVLASTTVLGVVAVDLVGGRAGRRALDGLRDLLLRHAGAISAVVLLLIGATVLGQGLGGIG
ncbi:GAP family protein [Jannaschia sp. R86511]|uniref:GAP family protein n=1 Tax=Jannaschia sp. R86511 TaxID=3093853 RepID=UPI0036D3EE0D